MRPACRTVARLPRHGQKCRQKAIVQILISSSRTSSIKSVSSTNPRIYCRATFGACALAALCPAQQFALRVFYFFISKVPFYGSLPRLLFRPLHGQHRPVLHRSCSPVPTGRVPPCLCGLHPRRRMRSGGLAGRTSRRLPIA